jgi:pimeloyl-ACP methyl ester carboxylesterase
VTIRAHWYGPEDGPLVVLVHGLGGSHRAWRSVIPLLHDDVRVLAVDLVGTDDVAAQGAALADLLGGRPAVIVGHSRGGLVAVAAAEHRATLVRRLILINTPPTVAGRMTARSGTEQLLRLPVVGGLLWKLADTGRLRAGLATAVAPGAAVPSVLVADLQATTHADFVAATTSVDSYVTEAPLSQRLSRLPESVGVDVVFGLLDRRVDADVAAAETQKVARARWLPLTGSGHTPPLEDPTAVARVVRDAVTEEMP